MLDLMRRLFILGREFPLTWALLNFRFQGYLVDAGWFEAKKNKASVDRNCRPIPWCSYPFNDFLDPRLTKEMDVFEFGSGNSTLYFADKVRSVTSVEHDKGWYEKISGMTPENARIFYQELEYGGEYSRTSLRSGQGYNIVFVDGRDRVRCALNAVGSLKDDGVILFDDSQGEKYKEAFDKLSRMGFRYIDFTGFGPGYMFKKSTTVFYRENNCLGI